MLSALLLIPFLGALGLLLWPGQPTPDQARRTALILLVVQLIWTLRVLLDFDPGSPGLQLQESFAWVSRIGLDYRLGVDGLSMPLVVINAALTLVSAVCTRDISQRPRLYFALLLVQATRLAGAALSWAAFAVLGVGALGCVAGGWWARRIGSARVAAWQLFGSLFFLSLIHI